MFESIFGNFTSRTSIERTEKEKLLLSKNSHWKGSTAAHTPRLHRHHTHGSGVPFLTWRTALMALMVSLGGMIFGFDTGIISGIINMSNFEHLFGDVVHPLPHLGNVRSGLVVGLLSIGTMCGSLLSGALADILGRKRSIMIACLIFILGMVVQITTQHAWYQVAVGRLIAGVGIGSLSVLAPLYETETAPTHIREVVVSTYQLLITLGILIGNCVVLGTETIGNTASWRVPMGISFAWAIILAIGIGLFPETPKYEFSRGRISAARQTMSKFYGVPEDHDCIADQLAEMKVKADAAARMTTAPWYTLLASSTMPYRILLGASLQAFQQLTGANYFFYYGNTVFESTGLDNSYITQIILGAVNFTCTLFGLWLVSRLTRRQCLTGGAGWMFICFMIFASLGKYKLVRADGTNDPQIGKVMIAFSCFFIAAFASTWGPLVWTVVGELYPNNCRSMCMGIATAANWIFTFLIAFFTPFITEAIGFAYGYVFGGCCFVAMAVVYFFLIESKGRTLEEIDTMYLLRTEPWKSRNWIHPHDNGVGRSAQDTTRPSRSKIQQQAEA